jgi:predicted acyl esterase
VPGLPIVPYPGFNPHSRILPKGSKRNEYNLALTCDILLEKDFTFHMRDGVRIYGDIYRPAPQHKGDIQENVPVIMTWAPYGKEGNSEKFHDRLPERLGIRREMYSGYEAWEGPDPAYWCVHPDRELKTSSIRSSAEIPAYI